MIPINTNIVSKNQSKASTLISGYIQEIELYFNIIIPISISIMIEKFCGILYHRKAFSQINNRSSHNGCTIFINKTEYIFMFGGYSFGKIYLNDAYLISSNLDIT